MRKLSKQTIANKRGDRIAKSVIWFFAGLTIAILAWIIGYIMIKGFYYDKRPWYDVTDVEELSVPMCPPNDCEFTIITHKKIDADDLKYSDLQTIYTKPRRENWGFYTRQDIKVHPFAFKTDSGIRFGDSFKEFILTDEGETSEFSKYTNYVTTPEEMVEKVSITKGAIGVLPVDSLSTLSLKKVNRVPLRRISLIIHPSVMEIIDNEKLQEITQQDLEGIFTGEITNWASVGGIDLPVRIVLPPDNIKPYDQLIQMHFEETYRPPENSVPTRSMEDFYDTMGSTVGGVGMTFYKEAVESGFEILPVERRERGVNLTLRFLVKPPARSGKWGGISYIIINTLLLITMTLVFSTPIGIAAAIFLVEYARQGRLVRILRMGTETLAGVPSIVFGLFGHILFVRILGIGIGFISATLTVTLMILPTIVRTTEEALKAVPMSYREGSLALGATKLQTIWKVVLPAASPGILTGVILAIGRVVGETAVLLYTLGSSYSLVDSLTSSARVLSLHLYLLFSEAISFERAFATGAVLVFIIILVNFSTTRLIGRMNKMAGK